MPFLPLPVPELAFAARPEASPPRDMLRCKVLVMAFLLVAPLLIYWPVLDAQLVNFDDDTYVSQNSHVQAGLSVESLLWAFTTTHASNWHPLTWLSLQLDHELFGLNPFGYHAMNVALHTASGLLLFRVLFGMTGALWPSGLAAGLFALHPLHVESVAWVSERKDVLSTVFWMLTLLLYHRYAQWPGTGRYLLMTASFALGLMAKPMLVTLPCVLLLLDYWPLERLRFHPDKLKIHKVQTLHHLLIEKLPLLALAAVSCIITFLVQRGAGSTTLEPWPIELRMLNAVVSYVRYLGLTLWPTELAVFYPYPRHTLLIWQALACLLLLSLLTVLAFWWGRKHGYLTVGWLWYLGTLLPVIGLIQVGRQSHADRYTYVPLIGIFIILAWGMADLAKWLCQPAILPAAAGAALLAACGMCTALQARHWHDSQALWEHALAVTTQNYVAHHGLALAHASTGGFDVALRHAAAAVELKGDYAEAHCNLGAILGRLGRYDHATEHLREAISLRPGFAEAHHNLALVFYRQGKHEEASCHFGQAVRLAPESAEAQHNWGMANYARGQLPEAIAAYRRAVQLSPHTMQYHCSLGLALHDRGERDAASSEFGLAFRLDPSWPEKAVQAAWVLATHPDENRRHGFLALQMARQARAATSEPNPQLLNALAAAHAEVGQFDEAVAMTRQAMALLSAGQQREALPDIERRLHLYEMRTPFRTDSK